MTTIPAASGIYLIRNTQTGQVYIGASKNMRARVRAQRRALEAHTHSNKAMQADWLAMGADAFAFEIGELVTDAGEMQSAENRLIEAHAGKCYNRKPSNMRITSASEKDAATFRAFHDWRILLYARLAVMDMHFLKTLQGDLQNTLAEIAGELERRTTGQ